MSADFSHFFEKLFVDHNDGLVRFINRRLRSAADAEDIAQNAFVRVQKIAELPEMENVKAYLYQVASNLIVDQKRREKLHRTFVMTEEMDREAELVQELHFESPENLLIAQRQLQSLERAMAKLPEKVRYAFLLHRNKGMSYSEIALEMSVTVSSVEKYILRALKHFRQYLEKEAADELVS